MAEKQGPERRRKLKTRQEVEAEIQEEIAAKNKVTETTDPYVVSQAMISAKWKTQRGFSSKATRR